MKFEKSFQPSLSKSSKSCIRQNFSISSPIICYITKNVSSPTVYHKLVKCCKYFFEENPILSVHCLKFLTPEWKFCDYIGEECCKDIGSNTDMCHACYNKINLNIITQKIWVTNYFSYFNPSEFIIPKNIKLSVRCLEIWDTVITLDQLVAIGSTPTDCTFFGVTVRNSDDSKVTLAKIIDSFPMLEKFKFCSPSSNISKTTVKELTETPKFGSLKMFELTSVSEDFDIQGFYEFLIKNKTMDVHIYFKNSISECFCKTIEDVIDKILELFKSEDFWPPFLYIIGGEPTEQRKRMTKAHFTKKSCIYL